MLILKILGFAFLIAGFGTVLEARNIVRKFEMDKKVKCDFEGEMSEQEIEEYKLTRAAVNVKMLGMILSIPGLVLILMAFK